MTLRMAYDNRPPSEHMMEFCIFFPLLTKLKRSFTWSHSPFVWFHLIRFAFYYCHRICLCAWIERIEGKLNNESSSVRALIHLSNARDCSPSSLRWCNANYVWLGLMMKKWRDVTKSHISSYRSIVKNYSFRYLSFFHNYITVAFVPNSPVTLLLTPTTVCVCVCVGRELTAAHTEYLLDPSQFLHVVKHICHVFGRT